MSLALNVAAIVISLCAAAFSAFFGLRQLRSMQRANSTTVAIELLTRECRSNEFLDSEEFVLYKLSGSPPDDGVNGLPPEQRRHVSRIGLFFSSLGALSVFGGIETRMIVSLVPTRARRAWLALEPYIIAERRLRSPTYLSFFEHLVCLIADADPAKHHDGLGLRKMGLPSVAPKTEFLKASSDPADPSRDPENARNAAH
ncbi:DUF4760 domain-containing protein [Paractinoplanes rishiriensis]|uniref:Uncharacterized protein n=1 Tax=Paractinoplanes rishiriensis TaxID=1050105 RepID=A0A919K3E0_9ACTN|nr:hypothetical protein [Actinoplanes rishiriensis]GIE98537.1 hypothetical protein Ari01nite_60020 [Actinoplanes rishiriensis]